jgi:two-component system cell cycle response regulator DivK
VSSTAPLVLVVDDNALNIELVRYVLEAGGLRVHTAVDATEARAQLQAERPALILMDIQLPGMDGMALTGQLKADPATRGIAIVAVTAYAMKGDEARLLAAGCDGYLAKPIDVARFANQVRALLPAGGA